MKTSWWGRSTASTWASFGSPGESPWRSPPTPCSSSPPTDGSERRGSRCTSWRPTPRRAACRSAGWRSTSTCRPTLSDADLSALWEAFHATCEDLGIAIVTGHTGRYDGCEWPMVGGATCMALGPADAYVTPTMARPGDAVVVTKGAAIETTALFAATFPDRLAAGVGEETVASRRRAVRVDDGRARGDRRPSASVCATRVSRRCTTRPRAA